MQIKNLLPAVLASVASAQSLTEVLAAQNATLSSLSSLLATQPDLVSALGSASNITILAPSNDALAAFLNSTEAAAATSSGAIAAILQYHVLSGVYPASAFTATPAFAPTLLTNTSYTNVTGGQVVEAAANGSTVSITSGLLSSSQVTVANVNFTGGIVHVIDKLLTVPVSPSLTATAANLTSLVGALTSADLASTVDGLSDVTIFAPSNAAFQAIGSALGNLSTTDLSSILTYHVVQGTVGYSSILSNTTLTTVQGGNVTITVENGNVFVNSAKVIIPNVLVSNGVVHVIDAVLNPNNTSAAPNPTSTGVAFTGASSATDVPFTSGVASPTSAIATSASSAAASSLSTGGVPRAMETGAMGLAMLFGGAAVLMA